MIGHVDGDKTNRCSRCGIADQFKRSREYVEVHYLVVTDEGDGSVTSDVDSEDTDGPTTEWTYECLHCGASSDDLADLLADRDEEGEE